MINRKLLKILLTVAKQYPVVTVIGPRQSGKSTLVQAGFPGKPYVNLEDPEMRRYATEDPRAFLNNYPKGAILDEIQNTPELLSYLQVLVDAQQQNGLFILTGSHQLSLHEAISQSLAGRTALLTLLPLSLQELNDEGIEYAVDKQIIQGGYPRIYQQHLDPTRTYADYYRTYVQRDLRQMIQVKNLNLFEKFMKLCAGLIGNVFEASGLANEVGVSSHTINHWLSILEASFIVFRLQPYFENFGKRMIKSPKLYFTDVGLASYLLDIENLAQVKRDPLRGALFENLVILELMKHRLNQGKTANLYYYRDNHRNEVDVIIKHGHELIPIEIKSAQTFHPRFLKGLQHYKALASPRVSNAYLIYDGSHEQLVNECQVLNYRNTRLIWDKMHD